MLRITARCLRVATLTTLLLSGSVLLRGAGLLRQIATLSLLILALILLLLLTTRLCILTGSTGPALLSSTRWSLTGLTHARRILLLPRVLLLIPLLLRPRLFTLASRRWSPILLTLRSRSRLGGLLLSTGLRLTKSLLRRSRFVLLRRRPTARLGLAFLTFWSARPRL